MTLQEVDDLEARIHGLTLPEAPFELVSGTIITDVQGFLDASFVMLRNNQKGPVAEAIVWRLNKFISLVEEMQ